MATKRISLSGFDAVDFSNKTNSRQEKKTGFRASPVSKTSKKSAERKKKN